ncbi:Kynureninase (L-kynurenine hydrolase), partial [Coemansia sp. RSA 2399]
PIEVGVMNTLTVNLHLMLAAFYKPTAKRFKVLIESKAFPSDHYAIESQIQWHKLPSDAMLLATPRDGELTLRTSDILELIEREGDTIAVVVLSGIQYYTGQVFEMEKITAAAQAKGCVVGWDLAHAAGNIPVKLHDWNVDFACWCTYKYMNSGPGGISGFFVHERYAHDSSLPRLLGWWAHDEKSRFEMTNSFVPNAGAAGFEISNTPIITAATLLGSLEVFEQTTMDDLRAKSVLLTTYLEYLLSKRAGDHLQIITPREHRGAQLSLLFDMDKFEPVFKALMNAGVICDERKPNCIRIAPVPLYNTFGDVWKCTPMSTQDWDEAREEERLRDMEREWELHGEDSTDYYTALNVSRTASAEEIRNAYKHLSRIFHPDKHHDPQRREWAQRQFHNINHAYEVLTDSRSRDAYDQLGDRGVELSKALGFKVQSPRDLQDLFEREARRLRMEEIERWAQSKSDITIAVNSTLATSPICRMIAERHADKVKLPSEQVYVDSVFMKHSFIAGLTDNLSAHITGQMFSSRGHISKNVIGTLNYSSSSVQKLSLSIPILPPHTFTVKSEHTLPFETTVSTHIEQHTLDFSTPPAIHVDINRSLSKFTTLVLGIHTGNQYALGSLWENSPLTVNRSTVAGQDTTTRKRKVKSAPSGVSLSIISPSTRRGIYALNATAAKKAPSLKGSYSYKFDKHFLISTEVELVGNDAWQPSGSGGRLGDARIAFTVFSEINRLTTFSWRVGLGSSSGVYMILNLTRLEHSIQVPVILTPLPEIIVALCAAAVPLTTMLGLHYGIFRPRHHRRIQRRMDELKNEQRYQLHQKKRNADEAMRLVKDAVERSRKNAQATDGLFIENAYYGDLPFDITAENSNALLAALNRAQDTRTALSAADEPRVCDVTFALHGLISDNQLVIAQGGSKRFLPGFYDPAFGVPKSLFVRYRFGGKLHEVIVNDSQALAIPMRVHCLE